MSFSPVQRLWWRRTKTLQPTKSKFFKPEYDQDDATRTRSRTCHREINCSTKCMGRDDNQITTRHSREAKGSNTMTIRGCHSIWWTLKSTTNRKEAGTSEACKEAINVSKLIIVKRCNLGQGCGQDKTNKISVSHQKPQKNSVSKQPHWNLYLRNAPWPSRTYATISRAAEQPAMPCHKTRRPNPGTSNSDMWPISKTKVSQHYSIS